MLEERLSLSRTDKAFTVAESGEGSGIERGGVEDWIMKGDMTIMECRLCHTRDKKPFKRLISRSKSYFSHILTTEWAMKVGERLGILQGRIRL